MIMTQEQAILKGQEQFEEMAAFVRVRVLRLEALMSFPRKRESSNTSNNSLDSQSSWE